MSSIYVRNLNELGEDLLEEGRPVSSAICINAAKRMERMEQLIVEMNALNEKSRLSTS